MKNFFAAVSVAVLSLAASCGAAEITSIKTVADTYQNRATLAGKTVQVKGKVVKVNNGIMGRNFVHVQDGTGDAGTNNLILTSKQTVSVGDQVIATGIVVLNRDFGAGYAYPLLIEEASFTPAN